MKNIIIIYSVISLFILVSCRTTSTNPSMTHKNNNKEASGSKNPSGSKDAVKNGENTNTWNSRKSFSKPKYRKVLKQRERILKRAESDKRFFFF
jgi:hypothetical protein